MQENKRIFRLLTQRSMMIAGIVVVTILLAGTITFKLFGANDQNPRNDMPTFTVKQGLLRINVVESGTINAREQVIIKSQVGTFNQSF